MKTKELTTKQMMKGMAVATNITDIKLNTKKLELSDFLIAKKQEELDNLIKQYTYER
jgi:hypothetical protein